VFKTTPPTGRVSPWGGGVHGAGEGFTVGVRDTSRVVGYEVSVDAAGLTGPTGLRLVAVTAKAIGADRALSAPRCSTDQQPHTTSTTSGLMSPAHP